MDEQLRKLEREAKAGNSEAAEQLKNLRSRANPEPVWKEPYATPQWKLRWRKIKQTGDKVRALCEERGYSMKTHDSHGFYIDITLGGQRYMLDPTPDSIWKDGVCIKHYAAGTVIVRDSSHHYANPTQLAEFNILDDDGFQQLSQFLTSLEG